MGMATAKAEAGVVACGGGGLSGGGQRSSGSGGGGGGLFVCFFVYKESLSGVWERWERDARPSDGKLLHQEGVL